MIFSVTFLIIFASFYKLGEFRYISISLASFNFERLLGFGCCSSFVLLVLILNSEFASQRFGGTQVQASFFPCFPMLLYMQLC